MASAAVGTLIQNLTASLSSASLALPDAISLENPKDGLSLLETKSDLFLSYIHHLVFLILFKLENEDSAQFQDADLSEEAIIQKLVELRVMIDRGVRPLENKLRYQIEKVVRAAENATKKATKPPNSIKSKGKLHSGDDHDDVSDSDADSADSDEEGLAYRPNLAALGTQKAAGRSAERTGSLSGKSGIYRPPRINPTSLATTTSMNENIDAPAKRERSMGRSAAVDEFIADEISGAPLAEPSIGSTIVQGGRRTRSVKEKAEQDQRTAYEESNFIRLPSVSKKEAARKIRQRGSGNEELRGLASDLGRIDRLTSKGGTKRKSSGGDGSGSYRSYNGGKRRKR